MNAAIYARRSTAQEGVADEQKSVTRQTELARSFAAQKGWSVVAEYADDGISGAEFAKRPGLQRLLRDLMPRAAFGVLVVAEQKALGREAVETQFVIKQLAQAGVEVWSYMEQRSLTPRNYMDKAMSAMRSMADEAHREDTAKRTHEALQRKAERGYVTGGRVFGYRNVDVAAGCDAHGQPRRSHVERQIVPEEATVVRRIFESYASGLGLKAIARQLTTEHAAKPAPMKRHDGLTFPGWAPSTVRAVLTRQLYRGVLVWNVTTKRDDWGAKHRKAPRKAADHWVSVVREELRIVPEELWARVASRRADTEGKTLRFESGRISGRPPTHATQNLLAGLATCGLCGGGLVVETSSRKAS